MMGGRSNKVKETLLSCLKNWNFMVGFVILLSVILVAIFAEEIAPYEYTAQLVGDKYTAPCAVISFVTAERGRSVCARAM